MTFGIRIGGAAVLGVALVAMSAGSAALHRSWQEVIGRLQGDGAVRALWQISGVGDDLCSPARYCSSSALGSCGSLPTHSQGLVIATSSGRPRLS
jgi:hypothetical protein